MIRPLLLTAALIAAPAAAEVVQSSPAGFEVRHTVTVAATPPQAWPTVTAPRLWWNKDHTYSDDSANLTLDERPGGCFCEKLPNKGGVEHMRVVYIQPPLMLRMVGGLGPLQAEGATGTMVIALARGEGGTTITMTYVVGGYIRMGGDKLAPKVDEVLGLQLAGLKAAIDSGAAPAGPKVAGKAAVPPPRIDPAPLADVEQTISGIASEAAPTAAPSATPPADPVTPPVQVPPKPRPADQDSPR